MKAIICDDEKSTCSELEEVIRKYAKEKSVPFVTEVFYSGDTLLEYLKSIDRKTCLMLCLFQQIKRAYFVCSVPYRKNYF